MGIKNDVWITDKGSNYPTIPGELGKALPRTLQFPGIWRISRNLAGEER